MTLALLLCVCATARAQNTDDDVVRVESNLVQLNVGVADRRGQAITNLSRDDFVIFEDGVQQKLVSFEPASAPFSLVLLLDVSGSTSSFRSTLKQAALRFIDALAPEDRVMVVAFNNRTEMLTRFTVDRRKIAEGIFRAEGRGTTELYKALRYALDQLANEGKRRKAIIVLTDGLDTQMRNGDRAAAANATSSEEAVAAIKPEANPTLNAVLDMADRQGATIYPLALPSGDPKRLPIITPQLTAIYASARVRLQRLADRTGGRQHEIERLEDLGRLYAEVAADLRTLYSVAYQPAGARARDGRWHAIRIEVKRQDLIARTRQGYFAR
ncbi:MAG: VWA domain-containing protein [Pyrinomonadaceae bacterium]|nr:VWA domain-containing protein [Pyrinomonadaceae bacterium]